MGEGTRTFMAVDLPAEIRGKLVGIGRELGPDIARVVGTEQMHITLFFLGNLDAKKIEEAKTILSGISAKKFEVSLKGVGAFSKVPRVIFAKIENGAAELSGIYNAMRDWLSRIASLDDRGFTPHITIARLKRFDSASVDAAAAFIGKYRDYDFGSFTCAEIRLKRSVLGAGQPVHSDLYVKELS